MNLLSSFFLRCQNEFKRKQPNKQFNKKICLLNITCQFTLLYIVGMFDGGEGGGGVGSWQLLADQSPKVSISLQAHNSYRVLSMEL
jgi:hypothetical protein